MELNKRKAELEFRKAVFEDENADELRVIDAEISRIKKEADSAGIEIVHPKQSKLDEMNATLGGFSPEDIRKSIAGKSGEPYEVLTERGKIVKENYKKRLEIAKLMVVSSMLNSEEKKAVLEAVRAGVLANDIAISSLEGNALNNLARFLRRCGIECVIEGKQLMPGNGQEGREIMLEMSNKSIWVNDTIKEQLDENLDRIKGVNSKIQLKNAVRYVKKFTDEEEKEFEDLQAEYLTLLKKQDELLKEFNDEEKLSVSS